MKKRDSKNYWKVILLLIVLLMLPLLSTINNDLFTSILSGDIEPIRQSLSGNLLYACILTLILMIIQNTFTIIPLIFVITINYTLFGFIYGFIWGWICSVIAAVVIYMCVKYIFQDRLIKKFKPSQIEALEQKGFIYVFQGRIFPFVPTSLVNILAGLSSIRFKDFLLGTLLGNFLYFLVLTLIPAGLFSDKINEYLLGLMIVLFVMASYHVKKKYTRKHKHPTLNKTDKDQSMN